MTHASALNAANAVFVLISFEGPDPYSQAGGLGTRVSELARALASLGYETHLFFVGDPALSGEESAMDGRLVLHRWAQWISAFHPSGVYDGEEGKVRDLAVSLPAYLAERIIRPAVGAGKIPVVLSEEWQTADCVAALSDYCHAAGLRDRVMLLWNANNPYGFDRIDWPRLAHTNTITAVSRHMRSIIRDRGVDALVIPNGIPDRLLRPVARSTVAPWRASLKGRRLLFKMARWEKEKGWAPALDAVALLKERGHRPTFVARAGGPNGAGAGLAREALHRGLAVTEAHSTAELRWRLNGTGGRAADVVSLRFGVNEGLARSFYAAADAVLANSVSEPFGLVGLEAMAAGGVVLTGGTGEDYAVPGRNAVVLETLDPEEITRRTEELASAPTMVAKLRRGARATARRYRWSEVARILIRRIEERARRQRLLTGES